MCAASLARRPLEFTFANRDLRKPSVSVPKSATPRRCKSTAGKARLVDEFCAATGLSPQARHPVASERPASATSGAWWSGLRLLVRCGRRVASVCWGQRLAVWQAIGAVSRQTGSSIGAEGALRLEPVAPSQLPVMSAASAYRQIRITHISPGRTSLRPERGTEFDPLRIDSRRPPALAFPMLTS